MKIGKILASAVALLMMLGALASCGQTPAETTEKPVNTNPTGNEDEIRDTVPTDLKEKGSILLSRFRNWGNFFAFLLHFPMSSVKIQVLITEGIDGCNGVLRARA